MCGTLQNNGVKSPNLRFRRQRERPMLIFHSLFYSETARTCFQFIRILCPHCTTWNYDSAKSHIEVTFLSTLYRQRRRQRKRHKFAY